MRIFIAINLPQNVKANIYSQTKNWRGLSLPIKWVEQENIHLTIKFCHELEPAQIKQLRDKIKPAVKEFPIFSVQIKTADYLPLQHPRIIYLSVVADELNKLANKIINLSNQLDFLEAEQRRWLPHITLGRIKGSVPSSFLQQVKTFEFDCQFEVRSIDIMSSRLTPTGPIYHIEESIPLAI